jgi:hypothetical protein
MVRLPRSFKRARVFCNWAAFIDPALDKLVTLDPLPSPRDLGRESWYRVQPSGLNVV